jgi:predicted acyltransferase
MSDTKSERLLSLDIFRGLTIAMMTLVNNPGSWNSIYPPLEHAAWHGLTPTDLVFPFFLFIVGVSITFSLTKRKGRGDDQKKLLLQIFRRGITIFLIGFLLPVLPFFYPGAVGWNDIASIRILGVLQRIGIVYIIASIIFLKTDIKWQAILGAGFLLLYWFLMTVVPVPGIGYASLEPGNNLAAYIDRIFLTGHMWRGTITWDPEGILSTLPSISTALCGVMLGHWLRSKNEPAVKAVWIFVAGNFALAIGWLWALVFPLNKNLWTSSYVLFTAGMACQFFGVIYWLVDVQGWKRLTKPFVIFGTNAIAVYALSDFICRLMYKITFHVGDKTLCIQEWLYQFIFAPYLSPVNASLGYALFFVVLMLGITTIFYKKGIFLKV